MNAFRRILVGCAAMIGLLGPIANADAGDQSDPAVEVEVQRPEWISGCSAWKHSNNHYGFSAICSGGNARYFARAWCSLPGSGRYRYGSYVSPGTRSDGACRTNEIASNVWVTQ